MGGGEYGQVVVWVAARVVVCVGRWLGGFSMLLLNLACGLWKVWDCGRYGIIYFRSGKK